MEINIAIVSSNIIKKTNNTVNRSFLLFEVEVEDIVEVELWVVEDEIILTQTV